MNKKTKYSDEPLGRIRIVDDFLPPPESLTFKEEKIKVTISLSKRSVQFFKKEAKKHKTNYQTMIRRLLDLYTERHQPR